MLANPKHRRLLSRAGMCAALTLTGLWCANSIAAASPAPADDPFLPYVPVDPATPDSGTLLTNSGSAMPFLSDLGSMMAPGQDQGALVGETQNLVNDASGMLGMPDTGSFVPWSDFASATPDAVAPDAVAPDAVAPDETFVPDDTYAPDAFAAPPDWDGS
jgi:hypothetical protein